MYEKATNFLDGRMYVAFYNALAHLPLKTTQQLNIIITNIQMKETKSGELIY